MSSIIIENTKKKNNQLGHKFKNTKNFFIYLIPECNFLNFTCDFHSHGRGNTMHNIDCSVS